MKELYGLMSKTQRKSVESVYEIELMIPPPPARPLSKNQMDEYKKLLNNCKVDNRYVFKNVNVKRMKYLYSRMSQGQKESVMNINSILPALPPPSERMIRRISQKNMKRSKTKRSTLFGLTEKS